VSRGFKKDWTATKLARKEGRIHAPSWISLDGHELLFGRDKGTRREEVWARAKGNCESCGRLAPLLGAEGYAGEAHHIEHKLWNRCDCMHNLSWRCGRFISDCHTKEHLSVRWTKRGDADGETKV
jgi:hypothetical protein